MTRRLDRIEDLVRAEIAEIVRTGVRDPRVGLVSIVSVDITGDLRHARILTSVLGTDSEREGTIEALQHARGFIRSQLAQRLRRLRVTPELTFVLDRGAEYSERINQLLETLNDHDHGT